MEYLKELDAKDLKLVGALLSEPTVRAAAEQADVSEATVYRKLREPEFRHSLREARYAAFSGALGRLQAVAGEAVGVLQELMADPETPPAARIRAAEAVLDRAAGISMGRNRGPEDLEAKLDAERRELERADEKEAFLSAGGSEYEWSMKQTDDYLGIGG